MNSTKVALYFLIATTINTLQAPLFKENQDDVVVLDLAKIRAERRQNWRTHDVEKIMRTVGESVIACSYALIIELNINDHKKECALVASFLTSRLNYHQVSIIESHAKAALSLCDNAKKNHCINMYLEESAISYITLLEQVKEHLSKQPELLSLHPKLLDLITELIIKLDQFLPQTRTNSPTIREEQERRPSLLRRISSKALNFLP